MSSKHSKELIRAQKDQDFLQPFVSSWGVDWHGQPNAPVDDEWSDLLLELTLAAAYANIMANTGASDLRTASSFLAYFALVWWIWASQVAYNTRFRTRDWIHRIFSGTQFIIFCAMATFTSNFDIFQGIIRKEVPAPVGPVDFQLNNTSFDSVFSLNLREAQLPVINDKGIAVTMGCSRLLLFLQYLIVFTTAPSHPKSLRLHLITLLLSSITYFASIAFIGDHPSETSSILKICFWFAPMMLEIISHFAIARIKDHEYNSKSVAKRSATLFIVVLGEGLNQITGSFKYVVGAVGFTGRGLVIMLSAGVIIIGELSLYCRHNWQVDRCGPRRTLLWFFSHYLLMASLILTLQAVRYLLSFANLYSAITTLLAMADDIADKTYFGSLKSVTAGMFPDAENAFIDLGLPFDSFIGIVNTVLANPLNGTARTHLAQTLIYVASVTFNEFDAFPSPGSPLFNQTQTFLEAPFVDPNSVFTLLGDLITSRLQSAFWFWGVAGGSLIILASMSLMLRKPADKYETIGIIARFVFGAAFLGLTGLTVGHNVPYFANAASATTHLVVTQKPWNVASAAWVIPIFAITLVLVNVIDLYLEYLAHKRQLQLAYQHLPAPNLEESKLELIEDGDDIPNIPKKPPSALHKRQSSADSQTTLHS